MKKLGQFSRFVKMGTLMVAAAVIFSTAFEAEAAKYVAKIGHIESAQQSRHVHLEKVAALVKERTNGEVEFQIFPQSQLGNQRQLNEGVQLGTLEATVSVASFLGGFNPLVSILDIPYLLPADTKAAQAIREGEFGQALLKSFSRMGVEAVAFWPSGRKQFTSNKPLDTIADFKDQKFRVMDSKILLEQFKAIGASAIPLTFSELYTSLQTGVIDGEENPLDTIQRMKFYEVQKYLVVSDHGAMEDFILFNSFWWNGLPVEYQDIIREAFIEVIPELEAHKAASIKEAYDVIAASGINIRVVDDAEKKELREMMYPATSAVYVEMAGDEGKALLDLYEKSYNEAVNK